MEYYWHVRVCWAITTVMSGHGISYVLCGNMSMESTPPRMFGLYYQRYLLWVCWLLNINFLETVLPWLLEDVSWLWVGSFGFVTMELQQSMGWITSTGKWIGCGGFIAWPPWSLDLTLPDFFPTRTCKAHVNLPSQGYRISRNKNIGSSDIGHRRHTNRHVAGIQCRVYFTTAGNLNGHCHFAFSAAHCTMTSYTRSLSFIWMPCSTLSSTLKWT